MTRRPTIRTARRSDESFEEINREWGLTYWSPGSATGREGVSKVEFADGTRVELRAWDVELMI